MLSSQSSYLNCISIILNIYLDLLSKSDTKVDLPSWFICVVLFSKCQSKDGIERKDSNKPHGTPRVPKKSSDQLLYAEEGCRGQYKTEFPWWDPRIYTILAGCVGIPPPAYSAAFHYFCYNTRWLYCTMFPPSICLLNMFIYFILLIPACLTFLPIATYYYLTITTCPSLCYYWSCHE